MQPRQAWVVGSPTFSTDDSRGWQALPCRLGEAACHCSVSRRGAAAEHTIRHSSQSKKKRGSPGGRCCPSSSTATSSAPRADYRAAGRRAAGGGWGWGPAWRRGQAWRAQGSRRTRQAAHPTKLIDTNSALQLAREQPTGRRDAHAAAACLSPACTCAQPCSLLCCPRRASPPPAGCPACWCTNHPHTSPMRRSMSWCTCQLAKASGGGGRPASTCSTHSRLITVEGVGWGGGASNQQGTQ